MDTSAAPEQESTSAAVGASSVGTSMAPFVGTPPVTSGPVYPAFAGGTLGGHLGASPGPQAASSAEPPSTGTPTQRDISDWVNWAIMDLARLDAVLARHGATLFALRDLNNLHEPESEAEPQGTVNSLQEIMELAGEAYACLWRSRRL